MDLASNTEVTVEKLLRYLELARTLPIYAARNWAHGLPGEKAKDSSSASVCLLAWAGAVKYFQPGLEDGAERRAELAQGPCHDEGEG
eukprot:4166915-Alexandrium_andersonii.AAC.1